MKKKIFFVPFVITILGGLLFASLYLFDFFDKLDLRIYDSIFHIKKEIPVNENITILAADDASLEALGEWPWSRDVFGDVLIRLKEFDAKFAVFDIEYISPSKNSIAPSAEKKITEKLQNLEANLNYNISSIPYAQGQNLEDLTSELININNQDFSDVIKYINNNISRDNDEYFARGIQFFDNTWLTVNYADLGYKISDEDIKYIKDRFLLKNVSDKNYLINIDNDYNYEKSKDIPGFTPALHKLISRAKGVSFTNSIVDEDGIRRRINILNYYDGLFIPQLTLGPLLDIYQTKEIIRESNAYIIKNAKNPKTGIISDIKIPLDNHGRMLINYTKKKISEPDSFKYVSIYDVILLDLQEQDIFNCLTNILYDKQIYDEENNLLPYFHDVKDLLENYALISDIKNTLLEKCDGFDKNNKVLHGISLEEYSYYYSLRNDFFASLQMFVNKKHLQNILTRIDQLKLQDSWDGTEEDIEYFIEDFTAISKLTESYNKIFEDLSGKLKNSYCIIGQTATSTTDMGATPLFEKFENVGIHANVLNTILNESFIKTISWYWGFLVSFVLFFITLLFGNKSNVLQNILNISVIIFITVFYILIFALFDIYIPFAGTILFLILDYIILIAFRYYESSKEKKFITSLASSFANKDTVEELRKHPESFNTNGVKKPITALFSDIQKFSTFSETINKIYGNDGPNKLIAFLNDYLGKMSNQILLNNGTIDKYEGDAIISMFGAPDPSNIHTKEEWAFRALDSAISMKKVEYEFNEMNKELFKPVEVYAPNGNKEILQLHKLQTRIGINSGDAFVGLMGSKTDSFSKLNYTMIGDTVNLASRLEGVNKAYKTWIMCSGETWNLANSGINKDKIVSRKLDLVRVVGRNTPVEIYNILGFKEEFTHLQREQLDIFNTAMDEYFSSNFVKAGKLFLQAASVNGLEDSASLVYAERCKVFLEKGCPKDWDFVINMSSK